MFIKLSSLLSALAFVALGLASCSRSGDATIQLDVAGLVRHAALLEQPVSEIRFVVSAADLDAPIVSTIDAETLEFELIVPAGEQRRLEVTALDTQEPTPLPIYWGDLFLDLAPRTTVDVEIPVFASGLVTGTVTGVDGTPLPALVVVTFVAVDPKPGWPTEITVLAVDGVYTTALPAGEWTIQVTYEDPETGEAYTPVTEPAPVQVSQGAAEEAPLVRMAPEGACVDETDADQDGLTVCADVDDNNPNCGNDPADDDQDGFCKDQDSDDAVSTCATAEDAAVDDDADGLPNCMDACTDGDNDTFGADNPPAQGCTIDGVTPCESSIACAAPDCDDTLLDCTSDCATDDDNDGLTNCADTCTDVDQDTHCADVDCDDLEAAVHPGATDLIGDGIDTNCDGKELCYVDQDDDGVRLATTVDSLDLDCDDLGEALESEPLGDCNDTIAAVHPGAVELVASNVDEDCDGFELCWVDADDDNHRAPGDPTTPSTAHDCNATGVSGATSVSGDCDDADPTVNPAAQEVAADGKDGDCNGVELCFKDGDDDGYRPDPFSGVVSTDLDCVDLGEAEASDPTTDCDDTKYSVHPGATEVCDVDLTDEDCDTLADDDDSSVTGGTSAYDDVDMDSYGDLASPVATRCRPTATLALNSGDCNDSDPLINPGAVEICDPADVDEDCDTYADDADTSVVGRTAWYADADADGYGTLATTALSCEVLDGYVANSTDCDDNKPGCWDAATHCTPGDLDGDGYCGPNDCSDSKPQCQSDCTDIDGDGWCVDHDANDAKPYCRNSATDLDGDNHCGSDDCNDSEPRAWNMCGTCKDEDGDGLWIGCDNYLTVHGPDCDDNFATGAAKNWFDVDGDGVSTCQNDCDDTLAAVHPGAAEHCADGKDNDCNGFTDALDTMNCGFAPTCSPGDDFDVDGFYVKQGSCNPPPHATDCNDSDTNINPLDADGDGYHPCSPIPDCNNTSSAAHPLAIEHCSDGIDNDCDGYTDLGDALDCPADADADGVSPPWDCDDGSPSLHPLDFDRDGFSSCSLPNPDCNDMNPFMNPAHAEHCFDGFDNDCDGYLDSADSDCTSLACMGSDPSDNDGDGQKCDDCVIGDPNANGYDQDHDGFSACATPTRDCVDNDSNAIPFDVDGDGAKNCDALFDCDERDRNVRDGGPPDFRERCDGRDNDCNGTVDDINDALPGNVDTDGDLVPDCQDNCPSVSNIGQEDLDGDGFGDACESASCQSDAQSNAKRKERCDDSSIDNDCDGLADAADPECAFVSGCLPGHGPGTDDVDFDGFYALQGGCNPPPQLQDCNDTDSAVHPDRGFEALEHCGDGKDNDCDLKTDYADPDCESTCGRALNLGGLLARSKFDELWVKLPSQPLPPLNPQTTCGTPSDSAWFFDIALHDPRLLGTTLLICNTGLGQLQIYEASEAGGVCSESICHDAALGSNECLALPKTGNHSLSFGVEASDISPGDPVELVLRYMSGPDDRQLMTFLP